MDARRQDLLTELAQALRGADDERLMGLARILQSLQETEPHPESPTREVLMRLGDRWSSLLLAVMASGRYRHNELQRVISLLGQVSGNPPISHRMLTLRLRVLERDGLVHRAVGSGNVPTVDYTLTPMGASLVEMLHGLIAWAGAHSAAMRAAQQAFDQREMPATDTLRHRLR